MPRLPQLLVAALVALGGGCGHRIGDTCSTNVDCSPLGDRFCDVASPAGYCTIEGCDVRVDQSGNLVDSCTSVAGESLCVRFFTLQACKQCDPSQAPGQSTTCAADESCLCDRSDPANPGSCAAPVQSVGCLDPNFKPNPNLLGHCAKAASERRWCMLRCNGDSDCRGVEKGYYCAQVGSNGAEPVPRTFTAGPAGPVPTADYTQKFCVFQAR